MARNHTPADQRRRPLPETSTDMRAALASNDAVEQLIADHGMAAFFDRAVELRSGEAAIEAQRQLADEIRNGGDPKRRLDLSPDGAPGDAAAALAAGRFDPYMIERQGFTETDEALREGRQYRWAQPLNATLTTGDVGEPAGWGDAVPGRVRMLHLVAGVPRQGLEARIAEHPSFTLPTATAGVGEGVSLTEYDTAAPGTVTLLRYGRFSDLSTESLVGASAEGLNQVHQVGVAKDLDKVLIDAVETDAGAAVAFAADVPAAIRKQMAVIQDATQCAAEDLTIITHPDNAALLQDVTPASGSDVGEGFVRFSGALVYPSSAQTTGQMVIANLRFGCKYFQAGGETLDVDYAPKTGIRTYASWVLAGFGTNLVTGYAKAQDVVTP
ncbi:MAG: hypothetical protein ACRDPQ_02720 [Nocardioidaceae bacterium]